MCGDDWHTHTTIRREAEGWHWAQTHHDFTHGWYSHYFDGYEPTWGLAVASAEYNAYTHRYIVVKEGSDATTAVLGGEPPHDTQVR